MAVINSSCRLEAIGSLVQITTTWCSCPLWNSGVRGQPSLLIFVTSQSSVSWWQLCYPSILPYPHLPAPPPSHAAQEKTICWVGFQKIFFFLIPISLCSETTSNQSRGLPGLARGWYCVSCSRRKGCPLAFLFDSIPCHSARESEVAAATVSCKRRPPCLRTYTLILWRGGEKKNKNKSKNRTEKKKERKPPLTEVFPPVPTSLRKFHKTLLVT